MANQTLTDVTRNMDDPAINGLLDGEDITLNNSTLTINSDSRWGQQAAVIGNITISNTLGGTLNIDGRDVWLLPFDASTGTVPALGTQGTLNATGSIAGVGEYLGIWATGAIVPSTAGAAMPATGFMKLRLKTVNFADNEVVTVGTCTITVNSATGGVRGWIHVVGEELSTITSGRMSTVNMTGDWFELGTTNGSDDQTFQYPVADNCPAMQVETAVGSGVYEWWLNADAKWGNATQLVATDERGKFFGSVLATGVITIARRASNPCGFKPASGLRVRIPNILGSSAVTGAFGTNSANSIASSRWDLTTTTGAVYNVDKVCAQWFFSFTNCFSVSMTNSATSVQLPLNNVQGSVLLDSIGIGISAAAAAIALSFIGMNAGGTINNVVAARNAGITNGYVTNVTTSEGLVFTNCKFTLFGQSAAVARSVATTGPMRITQSKRIKVENCSMIGGTIGVDTNATDVEFINTQFADITVGSTTATNPVFAFTISLATNVRVRGFSAFASIANVHPASGLMSANTSYGLEFRDVGTPAAPYNMGTVQPSTSIANITTGESIKLIRLYVQNTGGAPLVFANTTLGVVCQNVWGDAADAQNMIASSITPKGCRWTNGAAPQALTYNRVWEDAFTGTTTGRIVIACNEAFGAQANEAVITAGTPLFNSAGAVIMRTVGDQVTWTCPYFILGYTSLANIAPTLTGTNTGNLTMEFAIDTGSGFGGYLALTGANLSAQSINATTGFRLRVRATTAVASTTNILQFIRIDGVTDATAQQTQYPGPFATTGKKREAMRYQTVGAGETWAIVGRFETGRSVTCNVWNALTGAAIAQSSTTTAEIAATGLYRFLSSQLTSNPSTYTLIAWQMSEPIAGLTEEGVIAVGGFPDFVNASIAAIPTVTPLAAAADQAEHDATQAAIAALNNISQAGVQAAMTAQGYTSGRAPNLDALDASVSSRATPAQVTTSAQTALTNQGYTSGRAPNLDNLNATVSSRATPAQVQSELVTYDGATQADLNAAQSAIIAAVPTVGAVADGVWDENILGHLAADSTGQTLLAASQPFDVFGVSVPGSYGIGTAGYVLGQQIPDAILQVPAQVLSRSMTGFNTVGTVGAGLNRILAETGARKRINIGNGTSDTWLEETYTFSLGPNDTTVIESFELRDQDGAPITGNHLAGNNPLADSTRIIAERRRF